jgi:DNA repair photolyase
MGLNKQKGNMYEFVTHTWNPIRGKCPHDCSYCSIKAIADRFTYGKQIELQLIGEELKTNLGKDNYIFVGSSTDMFAKEVESDWIDKVLTHCRQHRGNKYLFQSKNPERMFEFERKFPEGSIICSTIESDIFYPEIMRNSPKIEERIKGMEKICLRKFVTIEPILDFNSVNFIDLIKRIPPEQINIGADSGNNNLPEPSAEQVRTLIAELEKFTKVVQKKNLRRLLS